MTKTIAEIRAEAAAHYNGTDGFDNSSRKNAYECENCKSYIVTVDREPGVTPFMVSCGNCGGTATSKFYRVHPGLIATHEWFRPETLDGLEGWERQHVEKGGLLLRKIGGQDASNGWKSQRDPNDDYKRKLDERAAKIAKVRASAGSSDGEGGFLKCEPSLNRADYPNRQQYRAAMRGKGRRP